MNALPQPVMVAREAMATRFEIVLHGTNPAAMRAAGEEALDEIDRLEALLSLYRPGTDISRVNAYAHIHPVRVLPEVFRLLEYARKLSAETGGAFDATIAPLVRCWGFMGGTGSMPDPDAVAGARENVGWHLVELDPEAYTVQFQKHGVMLDLGAIGKGYAIDRATELLREAGATSALIHGGTSSTAAIGRQPSGAPWKVAVTGPWVKDSGGAWTEPPKGGTTNTADPLAVVELEDRTLSVSAVWGRSFQSGNETFGHVIDPRTGAPVRAALLTAIAMKSATDGDALTTALLIDPTLAEPLAQKHPDMDFLVVTGDPSEPTTKRHGM